MALVFNHATQRVQITSPQTVVLIQDLLNACRSEEETTVGIADGRIASAAGKEVLGAGVQVGITLTLLENWQLEFWAGNYTATITGGNLVAASGDAVAYVVGGPQVEITLSAAATITDGGGGGGGSAPTAVEIAQAVRVELATELARLDAAVTTRESESASAARAVTNQAEHDATQTAISLLSSGALPGEIANAVHQRIVEGTLTLEQAMRVMLAALTGQARNLDAGTIEFDSLDGSKVRVRATEANGDRTISLIDGA
jgi:hypothetical protein